MNKSSIKNSRRKPDIYSTPDGVEILEVAESSVLRQLEKIACNLETSIVPFGVLSLEKLAARTSSPNFAKGIFSLILDDYVENNIWVKCDVRLDYRGKAVSPLNSKHIPKSALRKVVVEKFTPEEALAYRAEYKVRRVGGGSGITPAARDYISRPHEADNVRFLKQYDLLDFVTQ